MDKDFVSVLPASGGGASDKLDVLATPNASVKSRQTTISLQSNGNSKSI